MSIARSAVTDFFEADAANWDAYYARPDVFSVIHQLRLSMALAWVDQLSLPAGSAVLELGCGTGLMAMALARRGLRVVASDAVAGMIDRAHANLEAAGVAGSVRLLRADAARLPVASGEFDLVVALGLLPWVPEPERVVAEMSRVLAPGGHLIANCDNRYRLAALLDPRSAPALAPLRAALSSVRSRRSREPAWVGASRLAPGQFDRMLAGVGAPVGRGVTFGFGPFTLLGREVLPARPGVTVHRSLQRLADAGVPGIRMTGAQYLVLATKA